MPAVPYIKWFINDWESESGLQECSMAARGWWLYMIHQMYRANPVGYFVSANGTPIQPAEFARRKGVAVRDARKWIAELEEHGVFERDDQGRIYCRRIKREEERRVRNQRNGLRGGNPMLFGLDESVIPPDNPPDYPSGLSDNGESGLTESDKLIARELDHSLRRDKSLLRSCALGYEKWPGEVELLKSLALNFVAVFANCHDPTRALKHLPQYTLFLAKCRNRGVSIADAWKACEDALLANGEKPLFRANVNSALAFLPNRPSQRLSQYDRAEPEYQKL